MKLYTLKEANGSLRSLRSRGSVHARTNVSEPRPQGSGTFSTCTTDCNTHSGYPCSCGYNTASGRPAHCGWSTVSWPLALRVACYHVAVSAKRALITGITGQDGSYLSELLVQKGYEVHGIVRRVALEDPANRLSRLRQIRSCLKLHAASLESYASIHRVVHEVQPDECYHLAAQSFVSY